VDEIVSYRQIEIPPNETTPLPCRVCVKTR
jgi:hypothetical protein